MILLQETRLLSLKTSLGNDPLRLTAFRGSESLSRLFHFNLEMIADDVSIAAEDIIGKHVTFSIELDDGLDRYFHGIVSEFTAGDEKDGRREYHAHVVPWLWLLTLVSDCRVFQNKSAPDIIRQVFEQRGFTDFDDSQIKGEHREREYCVQYNETDFNFVSRLMEDDGIFYFFRHEDGRHVLVLSDQNSVFTKCHEEIVDYPNDYSSLAKEAHIKSWQRHQRMRSGNWTQRDYNFETPSTDLTTNEPTVLPLPGISKFEQYEYPGQQFPVAPIVL